MTDPISVLAIEDDQEVLSVIKSHLETRGMNVITASSGQMAFDIIRNTPIDVIISDIRMPNMTGIDIAKRLEHRFPLVLITSFPSHNLFVEILDHCDAYVDKLDLATHLYAATLKAIERKRIAQAA